MKNLTKNKIIFMEIITIIISLFGFFILFYSDWHHIDLNFYDRLAYGTVGLSSSAVVFFGIVLIRSITRIIDSVIIYATSLIVRTMTIVSLITNILIWIFIPSAMAILCTIISLAFCIFACRIYSLYKDKRIKISLKFIFISQTIGAIFLFGIMSLVFFI
jgi:hypothetical protein